MTTQDLPRTFAIDVVRHLRGAGYEAYWAGGCVRDQLLRRPPKDYDVATNATPDQIRELFGKRRTLPLGAAFGVITVLGRGSQGQIEVATFRRDAAYSDGRHPDHVSFSSAEEDAQRRDFTINGLFYDPIEDRVIDYVEGQADLERGVVRAIGDPFSRIAEDKLRMLRAIRFASQLDFKLDDATKEAVGQVAADLQQVSAERIAAEMRLMLTDRHRARAVGLLVETGLLAVLLPEVDPRADSAAWGDTLSVLGHLEAATLGSVPGGRCLPPQGGTTNEATFPSALAVLLLGHIDAQEVSGLGRRWKLSNHERDRTTWLVRHGNALDRAGETAWADIQPLLVHAGTSELVTITAARVAAGQGSAAALAFCQQRLAWPAERLNPPPLLTGNDLIAHGIPPGKAFRPLLDAVRRAQLESRIATQDEAMSLAKQLLEELDKG